MERILVNGQNKAYVLNGLALVYNPDKYTIPENYTEVEYLESTGTQYIDTGLYVDSTYTFDTKVAVSKNQNTVFWGTRNEGNTLTENKQCYFNYNSGHIFLYTTSVNGTGNWDCGFIPTIEQMYSFNNITVVPEMNKAIYSMPLFAFNNVGTINTSLGVCRIGGWTAYSNGIKIRNLIPVRDNNNIGYLYDTVKQQIFSNSGTGNFLLGKDVEDSSENMILVRHWSGADELSSGKWYDKIGEQYWTLTNATHQTGYYEFTNSSATSATSYGLLNGNLPDLGYHWKIVADIAVKYKTSGQSIAIDFGSYGQVTASKCAVLLSIATNKKWSFNTKFNGNDNAGTYAPDATNLEESVSEGDWVRRTVTVGVRASSTSGKDETYVVIEGLGTGVSDPFTPLQFNRWESGKSYIARSLVAPSGTYPTATSTRIYNIKVYKEQ